MRGPSDHCAAMCRNIQLAGIRRAGVEGYVAAGKTFGMSQSGARSVVLRYDEYAQEIQKEGGGQ